MIKESKYYSDEDNEDFENSTKYCICDNDHVDNDAKVRAHCHITGKFRASTRRDCNIKVTLNHNIPVVINIQTNYISHLIMQELGKFNLRTNVIPNRLEK